MLGDYIRAQTLYDEYLPLAERLGDLAGTAIAWYNLGLIARAKGEKDRAVTLFRDSLVLERELGNKRHLAHTLEALAGLAAHEGQGERAAHLFGFARALRSAISAPMPPANLALYEADSTFTRSLLLPDSPAWRIGETLSLEAAIAEALAPEGRTADL